MPDQIMLILISSMRLTKYDPALDFYGVTPDVEASKPRLDNDITASV